MEKCSNGSLQKSDETENQEAVCLKIKIEDNGKKNDMDMNISEKSPQSVLNEKYKFDLIVFVGNLKEQVTALDVKLFVIEFGILETEIVNVSNPWKVTKDETIHTFTFVEFANDQAYNIALKMNNTVHCGQSLIIFPSDKTHQGLFLMEEQKEEKTVEMEKPENMEEEKTDNGELGYEVTGQLEQEKTGCNDDKVRIEEVESQKEDIEKKEPENTKINKEDEISEKGNSPNENFIPVYKKSDHVAYLRPFLLNTTANEILQFLNFAQSDVVDICVLKHSRGRKTNVKRQEARAIIAFSSEECLEKCLAQNGKIFQDQSVEIQRHVMTKKVSSGEKRSCTPAAAPDTNENTRSPKLRIVNATSEKQSACSNKMELDLFVKHINSSASDRLLREFFTSIGANVVGVTRFSDSQNRNRTMGFVTMGDKESLLKSLALNGAVFHGNKIKVIVRNDRKHLASPLDGEVPPNYSMFVGNLPIKKSAEVLKEALTEYFKTVGCSVECIHIPLPTNHSGNRGYAFLTFKDENSLMKALGLNGSSVQLCSCKINISISNNWPENPKDSLSSAVRSKEQDSRRSTNAEQEHSRSSRQHRRRRRGASSPHRGSTSKTRRETPKKYGTQVANTSKYPVQPLLQNEIYDTQGSDYNSYLDYLEFRDYVARRNACDVQQVLCDYQTYHQSQKDKEFSQNPKDESYYTPITQSSYSTGITRALQDSELKGKNVESCWRNYSSGMKSGSGENVRYEQLPLISPASSDVYEKFSQNQTTSATHMFEKLPQTSLSVSNYEYENNPPTPMNLPTTIFREKQDFQTIPRNKDPIVASNSIWSSTSNTYNSSDSISHQPTSPWYGSSSQNYWERRESESLHPSSDTVNRRIQLPTCTANTAAERSNILYTSQTSMPSSAHPGDLYSSGVSSGKSDHDLALYSRINRRESSYSVGTVPSSSHSSVADSANWCSYPTSSSMLPSTNEIYPYSDKLTSAGKCVEEKRNNVSYEKSGNFVVKLLSSGILSSAGYNISTGYHEN